MAGKPTTKTDEQRFWEKVDCSLDNECWTWTAAKILSGYGRFMGRSLGKIVYAHRWSYEHFTGPIPEGLVIDHLCKNPSCVNPSHLEPVTIRENVIMRSISPAAVAANRKTCANGHAYDDENTYFWKDGSRRCRACGREQHRRKKGKGETDAKS